MKYNRKQRSSNPIDILKFETVETGAVFKQYDVNTSILEIALVANGEPVKMDGSFMVYVTAKPTKKQSRVPYRYLNDKSNEEEEYKILLRAERTKSRSITNIINVFLSPLTLSFSGDMIAEIILVDLENQERVTSQSFTFKIMPSLTPNQQEEIDYTVVEDLDGTYITDSKELKLLAIDGISGFKLSFTGAEVDTILKDVEGFSYDENNQSLEALKQKDEELKESIDEAKEERKSINSKIKLLENKDTLLNVEIEKLKSYNSTNDSNIEEVKSSISELEGYNSTNDESIKNINSNIESLKQYNSNNTEVVNGIKSDLQSYKSSNNQAVSDVRENLESYKTSNNQSVNSINENLENFKNTANQNINDINVDISSLKDYNTTNDSKIEEINGGIERNTNSISENLQKINSNTSLIEVNKEAISSINLKNEEIERDLTSSKENIENNKNDILNLNKKVNKNTEDIKLLKEGSIGGSNSNKEVIDARTATTGEIFDTLDERIDNEVDRLNKKIDVTMSNKIGELENKANTNESNISSNASKIELIEGEIETLKQYDSSNDTKISEIESKVDTNKSDIANNSSKIEQAMSKIEENKTNISGNSSKISVLENKIPTIESNISSNTSKIELIEGKVESLETSVSGNSSSIEEVKGEVTTIKSSISSNTSEVSKLKEKLSGIEPNVTSVVSKVEEIERQIPAIESRISGNTSNISTVKTKVEKNTSDITKISKRLDGLVVNPNVDLEEIIQARTATTGENFDTLDERIDHEVDTLNKKIEVSMLQQEDKESHTIENTVEGMTTNMIIKGKTLYKKSDGSYTDILEENVTLESFGQQEDKISILSSGKNLLNMNDFYNTLKSISNNGIFEEKKDGRDCIKITQLSNYWYKGYEKIKFKEKTRYTFTGTAFHTSNDRSILTIKYNDGSYVDINVDANGWNKFNCTSDANKTIKGIFSAYSTDTWAYIDKNTFMIEEDERATNYEPYKEDKKDILLSQYGFDEGLRGLSDSVCDELNSIKEMVVKRIEKKIINNNDNIIFEGNLNRLYKYYLTIQNLKPSSIISNYPVATNHNDWINATKKCILVSDRISSKINRVYIVSDLPLEEFKASLNLNPISLYYELAEPIETPLNENINLKTFREKTYVSFENAISGTSSFKAQVDTTATIARLNIENRALEEENKTLRQDFESTTLSLTDSDLELVKQNVDIDFRLMEVEFALDIPQSTLSSNINFKNKKGEVKSMARTPYEMMKIVILSGDYDREDYIHKVRKYYERGRMTKEEHDELMSLMTADEVISKKN